jgi:hypothetical protein
LLTTCGTAAFAQATGAVAAERQGLLPEPPVLTKAIGIVLDKFTASGAPKDGLYPSFGTRMPGSGWIAAGPGFRKHFFNNQLFFDVSGAISWRKFAAAEGRIELPHLAGDHLTLGTQVLGQDWTQIKYYGSGGNSLQGDVSQYRMRASDVAVYATVRPSSAIDLRVRVGMLSRPRISGASGWHLRAYPNTQELFSDASAPGLDAQPRFWHADFSATVDTLDHPGHPLHGGLLQVAASAFQDRDLGQYSFRRAELVAIRFVPVVDNLWTVAVRGTAVASSTSGANQVPFYLLPSLGGQSLLRGFESDRFHDRNLIAFNVESRWALFAHLDAALFADFGEVAPRLGAFTRAKLRSSVGGGLRIHTGVSTLARLDAGHSSEGWLFSLKLSESFSLSTVRRWATVLPIVP